ncbi:OmpA family protein [Pustulibacterium marinum]|uniref:OmpA family protein n=1 Tax=Pustulibacterium marinum TaxID=1224947 RepID=A0A1I7HZX2_9FLAO|nr:OmpA family protein [Pustulibacterium marinum]SFU66239.1 OmpA family protein [Pustulibacterium marinum]
MKSFFGLVIFLLAFSSQLNAQNKIIQLFYDMDVHALNNQQEQLLSTSLDSLNNGNNYYFDITGYTDYVASKEYNMKLAKKRADVIKNFIQTNYPQLIKNIKTSAHGELITEQITSNNSGNSENRRVDVVVLFAEKTAYIPLDKSMFMGKNYNELKKGDSIELKTLRFVLNTTNLKEESKKTLDTVVQELRNHTSVKLRIEGHVCCGDIYTPYAADFKKNQEKLSKNRAQSIMNYLISKGIKETRLSYIGYGFKRPKVYPEKTEADKAANRRVILRITYL